MVRNNHSTGGIIFEDLETGEVISDVIIDNRLFEGMRFDSGTGTNLTEVAVLESVVAMSTPTPSPTPTTTQIHPLDGFDEFIQKTLDDYEVPGAVVVVVQDDKVVFLKCYGVRELGNPAPVDENTRFFDPILFSQWPLFKSLFSLCAEAVDVLIKQESRGMHTKTTAVLLQIIPSP